MVKLRDIASVIRSKNAGAFEIDLRCPAGFERCSAGEHVYRRVSVLGPCVDADVGLGDGQDSCDSVWVELVEGLAYDVGSYFVSSQCQGVFYVGEVVQKLRVTLFEL